jgi:hypothetical protein
MAGEPRRWGHMVCGYLGGLPLIGGPITLYLALDHGPAFAAQSAMVTLAAIVGQAAHLTVFARVARRARWPIALAAGWASFAVAAVAVTHLALTPAIALRLAAAFVLAAAILWSARAFGPVVSGVLLSLPVTGSIMPPFTLALYGPDALARLMRGFVVGLSGFTAFFFVVSIAVVSQGVTMAFLAAILAALGVLFAASRLLRNAPPK